MLPSLLLLCTIFTPTAGVVLWPALKHGAATHRLHAVKRHSWNTSASISNNTGPVKAAVSKPSLKITEQTLSNKSDSSLEKAVRPDTSASISNNTGPVKTAVSNPSLNITGQSLSNISNSSPEKALRLDTSASISNNTGPVKAAVSKPSLKIAGQSLTNISNSSSEKALWPNTSALFSNNTRPVKAAVSYPFLNITGQSLNNISNLSLEQALWPSLDTYNNFLDQCLLWDDQCTGNRTETLDLFFNNSGSLYNEVYGAHCIWSREIECAPWLASPAVLPKLLDWLRQPECVQDFYEYHTQNADQPPWTWSARMFDGWSTHTIDWNTIATTTSTVGCCGQCNVFGGNVDVYYWPVPGENDDCVSTIGTSFNDPETELMVTDDRGYPYWKIQTNPWGSNDTYTVDSNTIPQPQALENGGVNPLSVATSIQVQEYIKAREYLQKNITLAANVSSSEVVATIGNFRCTSPSACVGFSNIYAADGCGVLSTDGELISYTIIPFAPGELSTIEIPAWVRSSVPPKAAIRSFNFADLPCPPQSVMYAVEYKPAPGNPYRPVLSAPSRLSSLLPEWSKSGCVISAALFNGVDPPRALSAAEILTPGVTPTPSVVAVAAVAAPASGIQVNEPSKTPNPSSIGGTEASIPSDPDTSESGSEVSDPSSQDTDTDLTASESDDSDAEKSTQNNADPQDPENTATDSEDSDIDKSTANNTDPQDPEDTTTNSESDNSDSDVKESTPNNANLQDPENTATDTDDSNTNNADPQDPENTTTNSESNDSDVEKSTANDADPQDPENTITNSESDDSDEEESTPNNADSQDSENTATNAEDSNKEESTTNSVDPQDVGPSVNDNDNDPENITTDSSNSNQLDPGNPSPNNANSQSSDSQNINPQVLDGENEPVVAHGSNPEVSNSDETKGSNSSPDLSQSNIPDSASDTTDSSNEGSENLPTDEYTSPVSDPDGDGIPSSGEQELGALDPDNPNADSGPGESEHSNSLGQDSAITNPNSSPAAESEAYDGDVPDVAGPDQELGALDPDNPNADSVLGESEHSNSLGQDSAIANPNSSPAAESEAYDGDVPDDTGSDSELDPFDTLPTNLFDKNPSLPTAEPVGEGQYSTPDDPEERPPFGPGNSNDTPSENELNELEAPFDKALSPQDSAEALAIAEADSNSNDTPSENELKEIEAPFDDSLSPQDLAEALSAVEADGTGDKSGNSNNTPADNELDKIEAPFDDSLSPQDLAEALSAAEADGLLDIFNKTAPANDSASATVAVGVSGKTGLASSSAPTASAAASGLDLGSGGLSDSKQQGNDGNATVSGKVKSLGSVLLASRRQQGTTFLLSARELLYHSCIYLLPWLLIFF